MNNLSQMLLTDPAKQVSSQYADQEYSIYNSNFCLQSLPMDFFNMNFDGAAIMQPSNVNLKQERSYSEDIRFNQPTILYDHIDPEDIIGRSSRFSALRKSDPSIYSKQNIGLQNPFFEESEKRDIRPTDILSDKHFEDLDLRRSIPRYEDESKSEYIFEEAPEEQISQNNGMSDIFVATSIGEKTVQQNRRRTSSASILRDYHGIEFVNCSQVNPLFADASRSSISPCSKPAQNSFLDFKNQRTDESTSSNELSQIFLPLKSSPADNKLYSLPDIAAKSFRAKKYCGNKVIDLPDYPSNGEKAPVTEYCHPAKILERSTSAAKSAADAEPSISYHKTVLSKNELPQNQIASESYNGNLFWDEVKNQWPNGTQYSETAQCLTLKDIPCSERSCRSAPAVLESFSEDLLNVKPSFQPLESNSDMALGFKRALPQDDCERGACGKRSPVVMSRVTNKKSKISSFAGESSRGSPPKIARPPNAFILYRKDMQNCVQRRDAPLASREVSKIIAQMWSLEDESVKNQYHEMAAHLRLIHAATYPNFQYNRRRVQGTR